ncbi:MAG: S41 family peptidase [Rickettsia endosymbiont of Pentastiridius leporinus]
MNLLKILFIILILNIRFQCLGENKILVNSCKSDLNKIVEILKQHSAPVKNPEDTFFHNCLHTGYKKAIQQCDDVANFDDISPILKDFINGFNDPHIRLANNIVNKNKPSSNKDIKFSILNLDKGVWINIPSFNPNDKEKGEFQKILSSLKNFRNKEFIVFDLSGNTGGSSLWQKPLLRNLWGDQYLRSLGNKHIYNQKWRKRLRVSYENFESLNRLNLFKSLSNKQDFYVEEWDIYKTLTNLYSHNDNIPVKAKIFVLTDSYCMSSCWLCVREMLQIPGVIHIGDKTDIQTIYSEVRSIKLPSKNFIFTFPMHQFLAPLDHLGNKFEPSIYYKGDFSNKIKLQDWFLKEVNS